MENLSRKFTVHLHCPSCSTDLTTLANAVDTDTETLVCPTCDFHYDNISQDILNAFTKPIRTYINIVALKALSADSKVGIAQIVFRELGMDDPRLHTFVSLLEENNCGITSGLQGDDFRLAFEVDGSNLDGYIKDSEERLPELSELFGIFSDVEFDEENYVALSGLVDNVRFSGVQCDDQSAIVNNLRKRLSKLGLPVSANQLYELLEKDPTIVLSDEDTYFSTPSHELNAVIKALSDIYHEMHAESPEARDKNEDAITPGMQAPKEEITFFQEVERNAAIVATGVWGNDTVALWTAPKDIMFRFEDGKGFVEMSKTLAGLPFDHKWALFFKFREAVALLVRVIAWDGTKMQFGYVQAEEFRWETNNPLIESEAKFYSKHGLQLDQAKLDTALQALKSTTI